MRDFYCKEHAYCGHDDDDSYDGDGQPERMKRYKEAGSTIVSSNELPASCLGLTNLTLGQRFQADFGRLPVPLCGVEFHVFSVVYQFDEA